MRWTTPEFAASVVDSAGRTLIDRAAPERDQAEALAVINQWRSSHSFPLNTWQINLRRCSRSVDPGCVVVQRLKRLPSVRHKLERYPNLRLSRVQDIGGCRVVAPGVDQVEELSQFYRQQSRVKHRLVRFDDYISAPKASGYRGHHLVYEYQSDRTADWNGLKIEIQIRSQLQHAWATTVETVALFTNQRLKSSLGDSTWLEFFVFAGSAIALLEGRPPVDGTPDSLRELALILRRYLTDLDVFARLDAYNVALAASADRFQPGAHVIFNLDFSARRLTLQSYDDFDSAQSAYSRLEADTVSDPVRDVLLVRGESLAGLRASFPNYFGDTSAFVDALRVVTE